MMKRRGFVVLLSLVVVLGSGTVGVLPANQTQQDESTVTMTIEGLEADAIEMRDVRLDGVRIPLSSVTGDLDRTAEEAIQRSLADTVEGVTVGTVHVENVSNGTIEIQEDVIAVSADIETVRLERIEADRLTVRSADGTIRGGVVGMFQQTQQLRVGSVSVEQLSADSIVIEPVRADGETPPDGDGDDGVTPPPEDGQRTAFLRVVHASPDAPAVDVLVENDTVLSNVSFGAVSDYLALEAGTYNLTITAADDPETVVFDGEVSLDPRSVITVAASGEVSNGAETSFEPVVYENDAFTPANDTSALSVVHLSPDAPAVDVTTADGDVVLADDVSFRNASDYVTVPAGEYTVEIREATDSNDGPVVTTVDVSLAGGTAYSALAIGYLNPDDAPADTPFELRLIEDATTTVELPSDDEENGESGQIGGEAVVGVQGTSASTTHVYPAM